MMIQYPHIGKGSKITMKDGSYKLIEDIKAGDEIQTYDMDHEDFDSSNIHLNEQTSTKVVECYKEEILNIPSIKIEFKKDFVNEDGDKVEESNSLTVSKKSCIMGGDNQGFMVSDLEQILEDATESPETEKIEKAQEEISEMLKQLDVGVDVSSDSDKDLISQKVISIEEAPLDVEMYCVSELENGDTIFVNDILVGVWRD
jgi:hypothetical protein|tara:strand:- start:3647 stop:4249 length:603 start_codon:yes stop_codon:yes gene_type:complete